MSQAITRRPHQVRLKPPSSSRTRAHLVFHAHILLSLKAFGQHRLYHMPDLPKCGRRVDNQDLVNFDREEMTLETLDDLHRVIGAELGQGPVFRVGDGRDTGNRVLHCHGVRDMARW
jgi:hypothetical protein